MKNITLDHCQLIKRVLGREAPVQRVDYKLNKSGMQKCIALSSQENSS